MAARSRPRPGAGLPAGSLHRVLREIEPELRMLSRLIRKCERAAEIARRGRLSSAAGIHEHVKARSVRRYKPMSILTKPRRLRRMTAIDLRIARRPDTTWAGLASRSKQTAPC